MTALIIVLCSLIAVLHIATSLTRGTLSRIFTVLCIVAHIALLPPLLLSGAEYELVTLIFLMSAAVYSVAHALAAKFIRPRIWKEDEV